ncbi:MAG: hypothetical protein R3E56_18920 [Burkholderiaceae bacterium]
MEKLLEQLVTINGKIIESAHLVLQRYKDKIHNHEALQQRAQALREKYRTFGNPRRTG